MSLPSLTKPSDRARVLAPDSPNGPRADKRESRLTAPSGTTRSRVTLFGNRR